MINDVSFSVPEKPTRLGVQRRHRTGRNVQFNLKVTAETAERFVALADKHGFVFGALLEKLIDAFEAAEKRR